MIFIGLDIGSTAVKAMALDENGQILARGKCAYPTVTDGACSTQKAEDWWQSSVSAVRQVAEALGERVREVTALSTSSQGGSMLALDENYVPLTDALTWMDRRAQGEADEMSERFGTRIYRKCGWRSAASDCAAKLVWLRRNAPEIFARSAHFMTTEEYINYRLCGENVTDPTGAGIMRLYNINDGAWDAEMLEYTGIKEKQLPRVVHCGELVGTLTPAAADAMGLCTGIRVYCGAHDQYCASLGSGAVSPGDILLATGTAWVIFGVTDTLCFNDRFIAPGIHPIDGRFGAMATLSGVGAAVDNHARVIGVELREVDKIAATRRNNAKHLLCCPCPPGRTFLEHRSGCCENTYGRLDSHDEYDVALAMMEGAAFEVSMVIESFRAAGVVGQGSLIMSGGAARSELWRDIVENVVGAELLLPMEADTPALGAAMIAAVYSGGFDSFADCAAKFVKYLPSTSTGNASMREFYAEKLSRYRKWCIIE